MSCHDIGRGMNSVVRTTVTLMDEGKISKEAAKTIICCCKQSVNWCDGNEGEAIDYISGCMCGRCLKLVPEGEKLYSVYDVARDFPDYYHLDDNLATDGLCEECFDIVRKSIAVMIKQVKHNGNTLWSTMTSKIIQARENMRITTMDSRGMIRLFRFLLYCKAAYVNERLAILFCIFRSLISPSTIVVNAKNYEIGAVNHSTIAVLKC